MSGAALVPPRIRLRALLRPGGAVAPPLFLPLAHAAATQVEALDVEAFLANPTKLAKGLQALHQILEADGITCGCNAGIELEAFGAELDWSAYPPRPSRPPSPSEFDPDTIAERVNRIPRIVAATEATRRLAATCPGQPVLLAAIAGPAATAQRIAAMPGFDRGPALTDAALLEMAGRIVLEVARQFLQAGVNLVLLLERDPATTDAEGVEAWRAAVAPIANLSRFHKAVPALLFVGEEAPSPAGDRVPIPQSFVACSPSSVAPDGDRYPPGRALSPDPAEWILPGGPFSFVTTAAEISPAVDMGTLRAASATLRLSIESSAGSRGS